MTRLGDLLRDLETPPLRIDGGADPVISALVSDSRKAVPGCLFFALAGARTDGRRFVNDAVAGGAVAVVASGPVEAADGVTRIEARSVERMMSEISARFFDWPSRKLELVGITGTNGKTTVTYLLESIWAVAGRTPGVIGTINYRCGGRTWPAAFTTPQSIELQEILAGMVHEGATSVAMEVSSHALALDRVDDCDWDGAAFTNLSRDHLDFHPDMESYFEAKAKLFTELLPRSSKAKRFAVIHGDDPYGQRLIGLVREPVVTFGRNQSADVSPVDAVRGIDGWRGGLRVGSDRIDLESSLVGEAHLDNILTAAAIASAQSIPLDQIAEGIRSCRGVPGRMERVDDGSAVAVFVDYAHTPDALERSVKVLRDLAGGRLIVVFGCGGDRDRGKRPLMGEIAARLSDLVVLTSDNPRSEDPYRILHEIETGVVEAGLRRIAEAEAELEGAFGYVVIEDRRRAIRFAVRSARPGDVILIAGKGHEPYQIIGPERHAFDDREEARRCLGVAVNA